MTDKTLNYYNENAQSFASGTVSVKFTEVQDKFLEKLNQMRIFLTLAAVQVEIQVLSESWISGRCS